MTLRVGIVGAGAIGTEIAVALYRSRPGQKIRLAGLFEIQSERRALIRRRYPRIRFFPTLSDLLAASDLLIEATSARSAYPICKEALASGKPVLALSAAGLFEYWEDLRRRAEKSGVWLQIPSGAIGGLDAVKAAACANLKTVTLVTRKAPKALSGAPYLLRKGMDPAYFKKETLIFEGTAKEAAIAFPQNINIAATLAAAGIGIRKTRVKIYATPGLTQNVHEIEMTGDFGRFAARIENNPSPDNPKTSRLAALSALACVRQLASGLRIGC